MSSKLARFALPALALALAVGCKSSKTVTAPPKPLVLKLTHRGLDWNDACRVSRIVCPSKTPKVFHVVSEGGMDVLCGCSVALKPSGLLAFGAGGAQDAAFTLGLTSQFPMSNFSTTSARMIGAAQKLNQRVFGQPMPEKLRRVLLGGGSGQQTVDGFNVEVTCDKKHDQTYMNYSIEVYYRRVQPTSSARPDPQ